MQVAVGLLFKALHPFVWQVSMRLGLVALLDYFLSFPLVLRHSPLFGVFIPFYFFFFPYTSKSLPPLVVIITGLLVGVLVLLV